MVVVVEMVDGSVEFPRGFHLDGRSSLVVVVVDWVRWRWNFRFPRRGGLVGAGRGGGFVVRVPTKIRQPLNTQRLGQREQGRDLLLVHVHLAGVHERKQSDDGREGRPRQDNHRIERRSIQRPEELREKGTARTQNDPVGLDVTPLGDQRYVGEVRLIEQ